jgi:hypothetical protein
MIFPHERNVPKEVAMNRLMTLGALGVTVLGMVGCETRTEEGALIGGGVGAAGGALIGSAVTRHHGTGALVGGLVGAGAGAAVGAGVGAEQDRRDRERYYYSNRPYPYYNQPYPYTQPPAPVAPPPPPPPVVYDRY